VGRGVKMQVFYELLAKDSAMQRALQCFDQQAGQSLVYGLTGSPKHLLAALAYEHRRCPTVIVCGSQEALEQFRTDVVAVLPEKELLVLPTLDMVSFTVTAKSLEPAARRMEILSKLVQNEPCFVLATAEAIMQQVQHKSDFESSRLVLVDGKSIDRQEVFRQLVRSGYERVDQVNGIGQFSGRGGIIDIFPINSTHPVRVELFDNTIDSLRYFSVENQRSLSSIAKVDVLPVNSPVQIGKGDTLFSYLAADTNIVMDEPMRIREMINKSVKENPAIKKLVFTWAELMQSAKQHNIIYLTLMLQKNPQTDPNQIISLTVKNMAPFHKQVDLFIKELSLWQERKDTVVLRFSTAEKARNFVKYLRQEQFPASFDEEPKQIKPGSIVVTLGALQSGFELPHAKLVIVNEIDIWGRQKRKVRPRVSKEQKITYFRDINLGDYVVHVNHGIGKYVGVETMDVGGLTKDYLLIRYAGQDKLYVPTDQVQLLQKYIGAQGEVPRLSKMGGSEWLKATTRAKASVADLAKELVELYAHRKLAKGFSFGADTTWQAEFEEAFPFEETPDQLVAIEEIKRDMESERPMDRLLCGDVGFGKTEVAIRAAFKAVMAGKQVAVLVPTTVLAQQHFQTFSTRFADFGLTVDVISRFRSAKEQRAALVALKAGQVDVLIGTHRILQADVTFKDLGLLIVDEEQRFGVAQKEKFKKWRNNIDVLALSATPIPRTLHMSLVGARDISIIETPPEERFPVQTYVVEYDEEIIRDAIRREIKRGGQVYFVYNKVQTIDKMRQRLSEMLPDTRFQTAHGQMPEELLEQVMLDYYEGQYDVLVCTSIIENGLDVSNANTIVVYDADHFGLSQLYQMRGRVGRSHRLSFAYLTYRRDKVLSEVAEKRLQAIKEFAELGSGFKIAMRDLEIRGAGNLLGAQQHGHIVSVGFEMYCRLLDEAVQELKTGKTVETMPEPVLEFQVDAYLSSDYISEAMHKIEIYQRIASIQTEEEISDLVDELIDRFGAPPEPVLNLLSVARVKNYARRLGIQSVIHKQDLIEIHFSDKPHIDIDAVLNLKRNFPSRITILQGPPPNLRIRTAKLAEPILPWLNNLLKKIEPVSRHE
jgi:transcription-repair coupling factor (superfamily II helicase)